MSANPTVMLNGDEIYLDELIRENARLTVRHEADRQVIDRLTVQSVCKKELDAKLKELEDGVIKAQNEVAVLENQSQVLSSRLKNAISDLHFVMSGGEACAVCATKCAFGTKYCKPVWLGEEISNDAT